MTNPGNPPVPAPPQDPAPEGPTAGRACEDDLEHVDELGALGTDCDVARRVAAEFDAKVLALGDVPDEPMQADGWTCSKSPSEFEELVYVGCDQGDSSLVSVTFSWGT
ncbi:MAG: hypothetical protein H0W25_01730 [Acidimicrobiia bacterium]|nr:hypothetical protein [Acidimicrobiia bacterium]